jgi:hypothetical protein
MKWNKKDINPKLKKGRRILCPRCMKESAILHDIYGVLPGKNCKEEMSQYSKEKVIKNKPLTEWEKRKARWHNNENEWHEDIAGRRKLPNGNIAVYKPDGKLKEIRTQKGNYITPEGVFNNEGRRIG